MLSKKIKELMIPIDEFPKVYDNETLQNAIKTLKQYHDTGAEHRSLMVFNKNEDLVGILTIRVILNAIKAHSPNHAEIDLSELGWSRFYVSRDFHNSVTFTNTDVKHSMRPVELAYIKGDEDISRAIDLMMENNINLIPVMEDGKVVGVLRSIDLLGHLMPQII